MACVCVRKVMFYTACVMDEVIMKYCLREKSIWIIIRVIRRFIMTIDNDNLLERIMQSLDRFSYLKASEIPDIDL